MKWYNWYLKLQPLQLIFETSTFTTDIWNFNLYNWYLKLQPLQLIFETSTFTTDIWNFNLYNWYLKLQPLQLIFETSTFTTDIWNFNLYKFAHFHIDKANYLRKTSPWFCIRYPISYIFTWSNPKYDHDSTNDYNPMDGLNFTASLLRKNLRDPISVDNHNSTYRKWSS